MIHKKGHQTQLHITFEHKLSWSKVSIDDEIPVSLALRHIKAIMEPYLVEFGKVKSYKKWNGKIYIYLIIIMLYIQLFFISGLVGNNISSCENYAMDSSYFLIGSASQCMTPPGLFDINTNFEQVQNLCWKLALQLQHSASPKLLETFEQETRHKVQESMHFSTVITNLMGDYYLHQKHDPLHARDTVYELTRFKSCIIGTTPLPINILNYNSNEEEMRDDESIMAPSFEFIGPDITENLDNVGCLAPNAKLKPYTLFQLLLTSQTNNKPPLTTVQIDSSNSTNTTLLKPRRRSNSVTSSTSIWSSIPLFQKNSKKRTTVTPTTAVVSMDRWKSIKANHLQLLDRIQSFNKTGCTFTILLFSGSIEETQSSTGNFVRLIESPGSFLYRYERHHNVIETNRNSVISVDGGRRSVDQPRRESLESFIDHTRFSTSSKSSHSSYQVMMSNRLFNIIFITSSGRNDAVKYLNNTPPATVHSTFPSGLSQVFLDHDGQCYKAYHIGKQNQAIVIRPDGYIGTRVSIVNEEDGFDRINRYFDSFLRPPVDMNTAAAVVAAGYD